MPKTKLMPCPFCGGEAELELVDDEFYMVCCENCSSATSFGYTYKDGTARDATRAETVKAWNRRSDK